MDATRIVAVIVIAWAISASPLVSVPISLVLAIFMLSSHASYDLTAALGAAGIVLGRLTMAYAARRRRSTTSAAQASFRSFAQSLRQEPRFRQLTFAAGMFPPLGEILYPALGAVRAPLRYAAAGTFVAEWFILALLTWLFVGIGRVLSAAGNGHTHDHNAAVALATFTVVWIVFGWIRRIDWEHWHTHRKLRVRERQVRGMGSFMRMGGDGAGGGSAGWPGPGADEPVREKREIDDDIIEGEIVDEDDEDD